MFFTNLLNINIISINMHIDMGYHPTLKQWVFSLKWVIINRYEEFKIYPIT